MKKEITYIPINDLYPHPDNPRKDLGDLTELAESIKAKGVLQNLTVVPRAEGGYTIIIGHRRCAAAKLAGLKEVPCVVVDMTPAEQIQTMLLENIQRSDLTVYEQAKGFQMMLDFGDTVESVSEKTGFSQSTIRRRLKIAELDGDTLKSVAGRQISLTDYDRLNEIEDIETRNLVLVEIGTNNFERELQKALSAQKAKHKKEEWTAIFKKFNVTEIPYSECWSGQYTTVQPSYLDANPNEELIRQLIDQYEKLYYAFGVNDVVYLRTDNTMSPEESAAEREDQRKYAEMQERRKKLEDLAAGAFQLRFNFIKNYSYRDSKKNVEKIAQFMHIREIVSMMCVGSFCGWSTVQASKDRFYELFGVKTVDCYYNNEDARNADCEKLIEFIEKHPEKALLMNVYAQWCDSKSAQYSDWGCRFSKNDKLTKLYQCLCALGYEMSDEEIQMVNGTHPLYVKNDNDDVIDTENDDIEEVDEISEDDFDKDLKDRLSDLLEDLSEE